MNAISFLKQLFANDVSPYSSHTHYPACRAPDQSTQEHRGVVAQTRFRLPVSCKQLATLSPLSKRTLRIIMLS